MAASLNFPFKCSIAPKLICAPGSCNHKFVLHLTRGVVLITQNDVNLWNVLMNKCNKYFRLEKIRPIRDLSRKKILIVTMNLQNYTDSSMLLISNEHE